MKKKYTSGWGAVAQIATGARKARNKFNRGQSVFTCRVCTRATRDTGDNGGVELCPQCFTISGIENMVLDGEPVANVREEVERLAAEVRAKGGTPDVAFLLQ